MGIVELFIIAAGLAMDACAVSICKGLGMKTLRPLTALVLALFFGCFQAVMPLMGWALGSQFMWLIEPIDHWVAFILLAFIGTKMLVESLKPDDECTLENTERIQWREFFVLAIATSIDALAVGISFAALAVDIVNSVAVIGVVTFTLSFLGVCAGHFFRLGEGKTAGILGGVVLILIGLKILLNHLGIIAF